MLNSKFAASPEKPGQGEAVQHIKIAAEPALTTRPNQVNRARRMRFLLVLLLWICVALPAFAQNTTRNLPLIGVLRLNTAENVEPFPTIFRNALAALGQAALGQVDGRNIRIELRLAEGHAERFPELAQSLVRENASVIFASGDAAVRAAQQATRTIPIIAVVDDMVASGLVDSLAKPGGNTTGVSILANELDAKRLELLKQIVPSSRRFAVLNDPTSASARSEQLAETGRLLGVDLGIVDVHSPADFLGAFASIRTGRREAVVIHSSPLLFGFRNDLCGLSMTNQLSAIGQSREMAEAGCLMSYGIKMSDAYVIAANLTDKMLKGARPSETPVEQPSKFELVINLKTAKALGLTVPTLLLTGADEVIE